MPGMPLPGNRGSRGSLGAARSPVPRLTPPGPQWKRPNCTAGQLNPRTVGDILLAVEEFTTDTLSELPLSVALYDQKKRGYYTPLYREF